MPLPSETEIAALREAWYMLRFVCVIKPEVEAPIVAAIVDAEKCREAHCWTDATSKAFWPAYTTLSSLIKPVTIDCLTASQRTRTSIKILGFWRGLTPMTLGETTSQYYIILLIATLFITIITQFYVTRYSTIVADIDAAAANIRTEMVQLNLDYATLATEITSPATQQLTQAQSNLSFQIVNEAQQVSNQATELLQTKDYLNTITIIPFDITRSPPGAAAAKSTGAPPTLQDEYNKAQSDANAVQTTVSEVDVKADSKATGISVFLLPILYAAIGAIAYILRTISWQLKSISFSQSSPIRHAVRLGLGVMMGLVIGAFSSITKDFNLQPLGLAFLAGYGVEVFFSIFDAIIERFKSQPGIAGDPTAEGK